MKQAIELDLKIRPYAGIEDDAVMADLFNTELKADGVPGCESEAEICGWVSNPSESFKPERDVDFAEIDGEPVAYAERQ